MILRVFREKELLVSQTPLSHATLRWCGGSENAYVDEDETRKIMLLLPVMLCLRNMLKAAILAAAT